MHAHSLIQEQRTQPYFKSNDGWYFKTRENADLGPYMSLEHARVNRVVYAETMQKFQFSNRETITTQKVG